MEDEILIDINSGLSGEVFLPSDKSITHRAILFSSLANGVTLIKCRNIGRDNLASIRVMENLGVRMEGEISHSISSFIKEEKLSCSFSRGENEYDSYIKIRGGGLRGLRKPKEVLYCANSGTTSRLLLGILSAQGFSSKVSGDKSLSLRPFKRITTPLGLMGAKFLSDSLPIEVVPNLKVKGINYRSDKASAQVKTSIMLAGLYSEDEVSVIEPYQSRNHTEKMFRAMGVGVREEVIEDGSFKVSMEEGEKSLGSLGEIEIPGDFSAASFFIVASTLIPNSKITIRNVCLNPSRIGLLNLLLKMNAKIEVINKKKMAGEDVGDLVVRSSKLKGINVSKEEVVLAIDEIPILAVASALASGETVIRGASELRVKESDRISFMVKVLEDFGFKVDEYRDGMKIYGNPKIEKMKNPSQDACWRKSLDHRISMSSFVLEIVKCFKAKAFDIKTIETSFPKFFDVFKNLVK